MERVNVRGTVSGRLRSSAPHMRSVRMHGMIRQRHLRDGFSKAQGPASGRIWPNFELIKAFKHVLIACKCEKDQIKIAEKM